MKKIVANDFFIVILMVVNLFAFRTVYGQEKELKRKIGVSIEVIEDVNGERSVTRRSFNVDDLSEAKRTAYVDKILDSLNKHPSKNRRVTVTVDEGNVKSDRIDRRRDIVMGWDKRPHEFSFTDKDIFFHTDSIRGRVDSILASKKIEYLKFRKDLMQLEADVRPKVKALKKEMELGRYFWRDGLPVVPGLPGFPLAPFLPDRPAGPGFAKASTIQQLHVYPNQPDNGFLNIRFLAPQRGDIVVTIEDTKGKEVGRKEVKDYVGEFIGQVELKKKVSGIVFVTVVQKGDGAVKRIVLSEFEK